MQAIVVEFDRSVQSLAALREAAYRIIGFASCTLDATADHYVCHLFPKPAVLNVDELRHRFLDCVTDENLREKVSAETSKVRDVILALAFGALAAPDSHEPTV